MTSRALHELAQPAWLGSIRGHLLRAGGLAAPIRDDGVRGVTPDPAISGRPLSGSTGHGHVIARMASRPAGETLQA